MPVTPDPGVPARWLVFGLSGQVGEALQEELPLSGVELLAVTRQAPPAAVPGLRWLPGRLPDAIPEAGDCAVILSLGPLDRFADWFEVAGCRGVRVVALGSTSVRSRAASPDAGERELARRLQDGEDRLLAAGAQRDCAVTVLRPTLMYGNGRDHSLTPIVQFARRWRVCPVPWHAVGRRQPVHVGDVAAAVLACIGAVPSFGRTYDLPGAEVLGFTALVRRLLQAQAPGARLLPVPPWLYAPALAAMLRRQGAAGSARGILARLGQDQCADGAAAHGDFGFRPRPFSP